MTLWDFAESLSARNFPTISGTIRQERPYLSLSHPLRPFLRLRKAAPRIDFALGFAVQHKRYRLDESEVWAAVERDEFGSIQLE